MSADQSSISCRLIQTSAEHQVDFLTFSATAYGSTCPGLCSVYVTVAHLQIQGSTAKQYKPNKTQCFLFDLMHDLGM